MSRTMCPHAIDVSTSTCWVCFAKTQPEEVAAEVERLRDLVTSAEFGGQHNIGRCPWCGASGDKGEKHASAADVADMPIDVWPFRDGCPAFTPEGEVR